MKFKYRKIPSNSYPGQPWLTRPYLKIRLFSGANYKDVLALVDSGADSCLFHASIANELGVNMRAGLRAEFGGIVAGHIVEAFIHRVDLQVEGFAERIGLDVAFAESDAIGGLLGGLGFLDNYRVILEKYRGRFQVESRPLGDVADVERRHFK